MGGMKVYPGDVDAVVERFDDVLDVCCFAYEDPLYGQNISLAVVMKQPTDVAIRNLYHWTGEHVAAHQMPVRWYFRSDDFRPHSGMGYDSSYSDVY